MAKPIIDVSQFNGTVAWERVKEQIDGAIIRCGYGGDIASQDDTQYVRNANECARLGIPFGVYLFSYARNAQEARGEADHVLRLVKGRKLSLPIYYDLEHSDYVGDLSAQVYAQIADAFCQRIEEAGGFVGIYANLYYWQTKLMNVNGYTRWLAQWSDAPTYDKEFKLWQYTNAGTIAGSSERTDLSKWYDDFLTMAQNHNDFSDDPVVTPPQKTKYKVGDTVHFSRLYTSSTATEAVTNIAIHEGVITKVIAEARNPYLINDGSGWVNDAAITEGKPTPEPSLRYHIGDVVHFHALYTSSTSSEPIKDILVTSGTITKVISDARNPYLINNGTGWVNDSVIDANDTASIKVNDQVKVKSGAKDYNGTALAPFVYQNVYQVMEVNGNRAVIGKNNQVTAAINVNQLIKV